MLAAPDDDIAPDVPAGIRARAQYILRHPDGKFKPSPLKLLKSITDGLLVVASDAVAAVVQELPAGEARPSGRAQLRLIAWVLADARGAEPLEPAVAETAGKRLQKQAQRVCGALADVAAASAAARAEARATATDDAKARLAAVDEDEARALAALRAEVYVGFHEVVELPALVAPEPPADKRARYDGCASVDDPAMRALVLRALNRNLDLELEAQSLREAMESNHIEVGSYRHRMCHAECRVKWMEEDMEAGNRRWELELKGLRAELKDAEVAEDGWWVERGKWEAERYEWEAKRKRWEAERAAREPSLALDVQALEGEVKRWKQMCYTP